MREQVLRKEMQEHTYAIMNNVEDSHWWFVARRRVIKSLLGRLNLPTDSAILEVGCGTGGNIEMLSGFGDLTCIEYDEVAAQMARERKRVQVFPGELPDGLPELPQKFDIVTALDVIEHIDDDRASIKALSSLLESTGRLVVTVPAFNFLWSQHDVENFHKRRYRKRDLINLCDQCGLKIDYISYFNFWLFPPVALVRLVRKILPSEEVWQDMRVPNPLVNRVLQTIFASERLMVGKFSLPFGSSLVAVMSSASDQQEQ